MSAEQKVWSEPRWEYRDGRVVCFDHMEKAFTFGASPRHFKKLEGTPLCVLCERERINTVLFRAEYIKEEDK